uniref:Uncharacterized protein n=1 Tax=Strigamia maritima TaxID=126957 RepID=T1J2W3_STRMM
MSSPPLDSSAAAPVSRSSGNNDDPDKPKKFDKAASKLKEKLKEEVEKTQKSDKTILQRINLETTKILEMFGSRLPYHDDDEHPKAEKHKATIPTRQSGTIREEIPSEVCEADCLTRGLLHGAGMYVIVFAGLAAAKETLYPTMTPKMLYASPFFVTLSVNFLITMRCVEFCTAVK